MFSKHVADLVVLGKTNMLALVARSAVLDKTKMACVTSLLPKAQTMLEKVEGIIGISN